VTQPSKRIGLFGGSFDPPHTAHIALAKHAVAQFGLSELRIIPTGDAWHKTRALTPSPHRLAMTRLAFADVSQATVDPRDTDRDNFLSAEDAVSYGLIDRTLVSRGEASAS
jgi:nicotinate-nucleotide adenylyltransferase